jgi:hypothetical protein
MSAWAASPYRAVNMYVGGASRGCPNQPNLTASWVDTVVGKGWTLIPTYVGLQATCSNYSHRITTGKEKAQGTASADDAVAILKSLGLGAGASSTSTSRPTTTRRRIVWRGRRRSSMRGPCDCTH